MPGHTAIIRQEAAIDDQGATGMDHKGRPFRKGHLAPDGQVATWCYFDIPEQINFPFPYLMVPNDKIPVGERLTPVTFQKGPGCA